MLRLQSVTIYNYEHPLILPLGKPVIVFSALKIELVAPPIHKGTSSAQSHRIS